MANYKVTFIFQLGTAGWSEVWYRESATAVAATQFTTTQLTNCLMIRGLGVLLRAVRANNVATPRDTFLRILNRIAPGQPGHAAGDTETPGVALLGYVVGENQTRRPLLLRGLGDFELERNAFGEVVWNGDIVAGLTSFKNFLTGAGMQIQTLTQSVGDNLNRSITQFAPANNATSTVVQYDNTLPIADRKLLIFHGVDRNTFPGITGPIPSLKVDDTSFSIPVIWKTAALTVPGGRATVREARYTYSSVVDVNPEDVRTKRVGRPSLLPRGRRSALKYRSR